MQRTVLGRTQNVITKTQPQFKKKIQAPRSLTTVYFVYASNAKGVCRDS